MSGLSAPLGGGGGGGTYEQTDKADIAGEQGTQRVNGMDECEWETRSVRSAIQIRHGLGQNNRTHRLQIQEGKPGRVRTGDTITHNKDSKDCQQNDMNRQHGQDREEEKGGTAGRTEEHRVERIRQQSNTHMLGSRETMMDWPENEATGTGYYPSKLTFYQRTLHM